MQTALRIHTKVKKGGKLEIQDPQLPPSGNVEVIILLPTSEIEEQRSAIDILAEASGHRLFNTAEEVDRYPE